MGQYAHYTYSTYTQASEEVDCTNVAEVKCINKKSLHSPCGVFAVMNIQVALLLFQNVEKTFVANVPKLTWVENRLFR